MSKIYTFLFFIIKHSAFCIPKVLNIQVFSFNNNYYCKTQTEPNVQRAENRGKNLIFSSRQKSYFCVVHFIHIFVG